MTPARSQLVLSLFPGVGLLDRAFEDCGFAVVRGPDSLFGGDVRKFFAPAGHFTGIIGGPPCQKFSLVNRSRDVRAGMELVNEYLRIVTEGQPVWWLMENVPGSPRGVTVEGYAVQVFTLNALEVGSQQHRHRVFHFGHRPGTRELIIPRLTPGTVTERACLASEARRGSQRRSWERFCELQGLPAGYDLPGFTVAAKYRAVGNGVPYPLALALAQAIVATDQAVTPQRVCDCGCGRFVTGKARLHDQSCRKRMERAGLTVKRNPLPAASQLVLV